MSEDPRADDYDSLFQQMGSEHSQWLGSALAILGFLFEHIRPRSLLDVGCGRGHWMQAAGQLGVHDVFGVDGVWLDDGQLEVDRALVRRVDLEQPFDLERRFDLALCMEVAEHVSPGGAAALVDSLVAHAPSVLFSAAIPFQGGPGHVNERFPDYWADLFARRGFAVVDCVRPRFWLDQGVQWWYRQNTLLYVDRQILAENAWLRQASAASHPLSIVFPGLYVMYARNLQKLSVEYRQLVDLLAEGGRFSLERNPDGTVQVFRVAP